MRVKVGADLAFMIRKLSLINYSDEHACPSFAQPSRRKTAAPKANAVMLVSTRYEPKPNAWLSLDRLAPHHVEKKPDPETPSPEVDATASV